MKKPVLIYNGDCRFCKIWIDYWRARTKSSKLIYHLVAYLRSSLYGAMKFLFGSNLRKATYKTSTWIFLKVLGVIYLTAFVSFGAQAIGLIGSQGILPVNNLIESARTGLGNKGILSLPTVFWLNSSDWFINTVIILGVILSILLILNTAPRLTLVSLFLLYLSLVTAGQTFMSFQWDILLLEVGFLAIFLPRLSNSFSNIIVWLFWWLLFRLVFLSGAVKLMSGDLTWKNLTALTYHYETQPLPTALAWFIHQLPLWFHKISTVIMFSIELVIPFLIFSPRRLRFFAGFSIILLELLILATGNYTFFNILTISLTLFLFDDAFWRVLLPRSSTLPRNTTSSQDVTFFTRIIIPAAATLILFISVLQLATVFSRGAAVKSAQGILRTLQPSHIVNTYGLFAVMTTSRPEIIIEGSNDGENWTAYEFKYKPGNLKRAPRWAQPHQPRLDWQMWFAALGTYERNPWLINFAVRLLEGSPQVLTLLKENPFPTKPPKYVRALTYDYHFTEPSEKAQTGNWWKRKLNNTYLPPISLSI